MKTQIGCGKPTRVISTNAGSMPCGATLRELDGKTEPYLCADCTPPRRAKWIDWSYPTSPNADQFKFKDGCWTVSVGRAYSTGKANR